MHKNTHIINGLWVLLFFLTIANPAFAQGVSSMNDIFGNTVNSLSGTGPFLSATMYLLGSLWAALGVRDLQKAVEDEQTPMRKGWAKIIVGGMLFALPRIVDAVGNSFSGGDGTTAAPIAAGPDGSANILNLLTIQLNEGIAGQGFPVLNDIFLNLIGTTDMLPMTIAALFYFAALLTLIIGIIKIKEHTEDPEKVPLKEPVQRILFAGALFALPSMIGGAAALIRGENAGRLNVSNILSPRSDADIMTSGEDPALTCVQGPVEGGTLGQVICQLGVSTNFFPLLLTFIAYVLGVYFVVWGIMKIRDHANNPQQTPLMDGIMRLIAGGAAMTLPYAIYAVRSSFMSDTIMTNSGGGAGPSRVTQPENPTDFIVPLDQCDQGLDSMLGCLMQSTFGPMTVITNLFSVFVGVLFIIVGISRLTKSTQEGVKGPAGIGTLMTFVAGAALLSSGPLLKIFANSMFNDPTANIVPALQYTDGMTEPEQAHVNLVIYSILRFLAIIGIVSFIRGIFILRGASEGSQNASFMAAGTHLIGGALAVNLGPLLGVIQNTLGISTYGIAFG